MRVVQQSAWKSLRPYLLSYYPLFTGTEAKPAALLPAAPCDMEESGRCERVALLNGQGYWISVN